MRLIGVHDNKPITNYNQLKNLIQKSALFMLIKFKYLMHEIKYTYDTLYDI